MGNFHSPGSRREAMDDPRLRRVVTRLARLTGAAWALALVLPGSAVVALVGFGLESWWEAALLAVAVCGGAVALHDAGRQNVWGLSRSLDELLLQLKRLPRCTCAMLCRDAHPQLFFVTRIVAGDVPDVLAVVPPTEVRLWGMTPLHWATWAGQPALCEVLMRLGADDRAKADPESIGLWQLAGCTAADIALRRGCFECFDLLRLGLWRTPAPGEEVGSA